MKNEGLARHVIKLWISKYVAENPKADGDQLFGWLSDADVESYDTPSDFMEEAAKRHSPALYTWWSRDQGLKTQKAIEGLAASYVEMHDDYRQGKVDQLTKMKEEPKVSLADQLYDLVNKNADYAPILNAIVNLELSVEWQDPDEVEVTAGLIKPIGWRMDEISGLTGGHLNQLVTLGAVRYSYKSEQHKYFRADAAAIANAMELYESHRAEAIAAKSLKDANDTDEWKKLWHQSCPLCAPHTLLDHATEGDLQHLREQLERVREGKEPDLSDVKMSCFKCECFISRTAAFTRIVTAMKGKTAAAKSTGFLEGTLIPAEDEAHFLDILAEGDGLDYWAQAIAPKIVGMDDVRRAMLIALASLPDIEDDRNRVHVLLWGEPGTAKTELAREVIRFGGGWADHGTSDVGLTADASAGELTMGLLPMNHRGVVGIDELDKFDIGDQNGVLESMETGQVTVNRGKFVNLRLPAEVIIAATANRIEKFRPELLDRFDFVIRVSAPTVNQAQDIMAERILWWNRPKGTDTVKLGKYLAWVRKFTPEIPESVRKQAQGLLKDFIEYSGETRIRRLERLIRIALAIARLSHRDVTLADFKRAIKLVKSAHDEAIEAVNGGKKNGGSK